MNNTNTYKKTKIWDKNILKLEEFIEKNKYYIDIVCKTYNWPPGVKSFLQEVKDFIADWFGEESKYYKMVNFSQHRTKWCDDFINMFNILSKILYEFTQKRMYIKNNILCKEFQEIVKTKIIKDETDPDIIANFFTKSTQIIIVFIIHGIKTRGIWKNDLAEKLAEYQIINPNLASNIYFIPILFDYGNFFLQVFSSKMRERVVNKFIDKYNSKIEVYRKYNPIICGVVHSFGTFIIGNAIKQDPGITFNRIILSGSVLPNNFPWNDFQDRLDIVLNEIGKNDTVPKMANLLPCFGDSGYNGFSCSPPDFLIQREHKHCLHSSTLGRIFMVKNWIPFLTDGTIHK